MKLDVTTTAIIRPEILRMTLHTFRKNLLHEFDARLIINVDAFGETDRYTQMDMVEVAREYFDAVIYRTPESPSFAGAVQWCWSQVETEFFFHLEDDFILRRPVPAAELINLFNDREVCGVTLNRMTKRRMIRESKKIGRLLRDYNSDYFHFPEISLNPSFFRTARMQFHAAKLTLKHDPEYQLTKFCRDDVVLMRMKNPPIVIDTGTLWRKRRGVNKTTYGSGVIYLPPVKLPRLRHLQLAARFHIHRWIWKLRY